MKRPLMICFVILVFIVSGSGSQVVFSRNAFLSPVTDKEKVKIFAKANNIKETFVEILPAKYEEIKRDFKYESFSDSSAAYYDGQKNQRRRRKVNDYQPKKNRKNL